MSDYSCDREVETNQSEGIIQLNRKLDELEEELGNLLRERYINGDVGGFPKSKKKRLKHLEAEIETIENSINLEYSLFKGLEEN